jgi:hypothetical protein
MRITQPKVQIRGYNGNGVTVRSDVDGFSQRIVKNKKGKKRLVGLRGFGVDLNGDGRINADQDGFLAFPNADGNYDIQHSNRLLKAFSSDFDLNNDGKITKNERKRGRALRDQARTLDLDKDGVMNNWELQKAGAAVVKDDGQFGAQKVFSIEGQDPDKGVKEPQATEPAFTGPQGYYNNTFGQAQMAYLQHTAFLFQSMMMMRMPGMLMGGGSYGGYPPSLAMPIY